MNKPIVFGVGLEKTGTTSLHAALNILGWRSIHDARVVQSAINEDPPLRSLRAAGYDAFCDNPIPRHFEELDRVYRGSKFILTQRQIDSWLDSRLRHSHRTIHWEFDRARLIHRWSTHAAQVHSFFRGRDDLLVMNLCDGDGWEKLCPFLGVDAPNRPFPWSNKSPRYNFETDDLSSEIGDWQKLVAAVAGKPDLHAIDAASGDFRIGHWLLLNVCSDPSSRLTCMDAWPHAETERRFDHNLLRSGLTSKVRKVKAPPQRSLAELPAGSVDLVYLGNLSSSPPFAARLRSAFRSLKRGGMIICRNCPSALTEPSTPEARHAHALVLELVAELGLGASLTAQGNLSAIHKSPDTVLTFRPEFDPKAGQR